MTVSLKFLAAALGVIVILALAGGLLWSFDPFHRRARAEQRAEIAERQASVAQLETRGARESVARSDVTARRREAASAVVTALQTAAQHSEDADAPLAPDRARRLLAADRRLCQLGQDLVGCAAD
jgi:hypothetical protein